MIGNSEQRGYRPELSELGQVHVLVKDRERDLKIVRYKAVSGLRDLELFCEHLGGLVFKEYFYDAHISKGCFTHLGNVRCTFSGSSPDRRVILQAFILNFDEMESLFQEVEILSGIQYLCGTERRRSSSKSNVKSK